MVQDVLQEWFSSLIKGTGVFLFTGKVSIQRHRQQRLYSFIPEDLTGTVPETTLFLLHQSIQSTY